MVTAVQRGLPAGVRLVRMGIEAIPPTVPSPSRIAEGVTNPRSGTWNASAAAILGKLEHFSRATVRRAVPHSTATGAL